MTKATNRSLYLYFLSKFLKYFKKVKIMNEEHLKLSDFCSLNYIRSFLSRGYIPLNNAKGFLNKKGIVVLFSLEKLKYFLNKFETVKVFDLSVEDLKTINKKFILTKRASDSIVFKFDNEFFDLRGACRKKLRRARNTYEKMATLKVQDYPNDINEVRVFLDTWKSQRPNKFQYYNGYFINFLLTVIPFDRDRFVTKFFYINENLVGFNIIDIVNDTLYNQLYRKANLSFNNLSLFIDYFTFNQIHQNIKTSFFVNIGRSGNKTLLFEKTAYFPVFKIYKCYDISVAIP